LQVLFPGKNLNYADGWRLALPQNFDSDGLSGQDLFSSMGLIHNSLTVAANTAFTVSQAPFCDSPPAQLCQSSFGLLSPVSVVFGSDIPNVAQIRGSSSFPDA
jgi:hypothetical protein